MKSRIKFNQKQIKAGEEASLYLLVFSMLLSPEIGMGGLAGEATTASRGVTIRSEDLLLVVMCFAWLMRMAVHKELGLVRRTPLNRPIGAYAAACVLATGAGMLDDRFLGFLRDCALERGMEKDFRRLKLSQAAAG